MESRARRLRARVFPATATTTRGRRLGHDRRHRELPARGEDGTRRLARGARSARRACRASSPRSPCTPRSTRRPTTSGSCSTSCRSTRRRARSRRPRSRSGSATTSRSSCVSAPSYPFAALDPVAEVAAVCAPRGIALHVDACIGGFVLPFWPDELPAWDFAVPGVTSLSADLHKYGYAPKGVSVLLQRGRDRQRHQYFATTGWPGYPVVNPTMLGSKSAGPARRRVGDHRGARRGRLRRAHRSGRTRDRGARATWSTASRACASSATRSARCSPSRPTTPSRPSAGSTRTTGPMPRARTGWHLQLQPGLVQADGTRLPHTTHLTITPVTEAAVPELTAALVAAADAVRGVPPVDGRARRRLRRAARWRGGARRGSGARLRDRRRAARAPSGCSAARGRRSAARPAGAACSRSSRRCRPRSTERLLVELLARVVEPRD